MHFDFLKELFSKYRPEGSSQIRIFALLFKDFTSEFGSFESHDKNMIANKKKNPDKTFRFI